MKKHILTIFMAVMLLFTSTSCSVDVNNNTAVGSDEVRIHFIDVGQADCILIELPTDEEILIDAGNRDDAQVIINYLEQLGIDDIEYFILTHPHEDHIGSAPAVLDYYDVDKVYMPDVAQDSQIYRDTVSAVENEDAELIKAKAGISIIDSEDISFYVLAPNSMWYSETNEYSLVTRLTYKDTSFLFTGDAEGVSETEMINAGYDIDSDLLKVGHHGGKTSTSKNFLDCVSPEYAVISVGKDNSYGHPTDQVLKRLNNSGAQIFRTDEIGSITAVSDGTDIKIGKSQISESNNINVKYIGNNNSMKFHYPDCSSVKDMKDKNKSFFKSRDKAIKQGFIPCGICKP
jgi:competence protein ComEC